MFECLCTTNWIHVYMSVQNWFCKNWLWFVHIRLLTDLLCTVFLWEWTEKWAYLCTHFCFWQTRDTTHQSKTLSHSVSCDVQFLTVQLNSAGGAGMNSRGCWWMSWLICKWDSLYASMVSTDKMDKCANQDLYNMVSTWDIPPCEFVQRNIQM